MIQFRKAPSQGEGMRPRPKKGILQGFSGARQGFLSPNLHYLTDSDEIIIRPLRVQITSNHHLLGHLVAQAAGVSSNLDADTEHCICHKLSRK